MQRLGIVMESSGKRYCPTAVIHKRDGDGASRTVGCPGCDSMCCGVSSQHLGKRLQLMHITPLEQKVGVEEGGGEGGEEVA